MVLDKIDWIIFIGYLVGVFLIGIMVSKKAKTGIKSYFTADRSLPWWWLGISIIATTFAADTPLAITGITAKTGIAGNWFWWAWAATYITVAIFFSKRWYNSQVLTDVEFIELRYDGGEATFLRGFKAFFFGIVINCFILGWVITAAVKIAGTFIVWNELIPLDVYQNIEYYYPSFLLFKDDLNATLTIMVLILIVTIYSTMGGIRGVILTDLFQFVIAIVTSILFAYYALDYVGGMESLQAKMINLYGQEGFQNMTEFIPSFDNPLIPFQIFLIYILIQWWVRFDSDGTGYIAQRINTAKSPKDAQKGSLLFAIAFIALRTWPWIIVALVSLVVFPLEYDAAGAVIGDREILYPVIMKTVLPVGLLGLAFTSLMAAFMSTVDTHLNWGASYMANDIYLRFINPKADQKKMIRFSKLSVIVITLIAILAASQIDSIEGAWKFLINASAGLGIAQLMRWFWWRANAWTEISAMITAVFATVLFVIIKPDDASQYFETYSLVWIALISLVVSILVTLITRPVSEERLNLFIERCNPVGFWQGKVEGKKAYKGFFQTFILWILGMTVSFCGLFSVGYFVMLRPELGVINGVVAIVAFIILTKSFKRLEANDPIQ